jgi:hypothetical protein
VLCVECDAERIHPDSTAAFNQIDSKIEGADFVDSMVRAIDFVRCTAANSAELPADLNVLNRRVFPPRPVVTCQTRQPSNLNRISYSSCKISSEVSGPSSPVLCLVADSIYSYTGSRAVRGFSLSISDSRRPVYHEFTQFSKV